MGGPGSGRKKGSLNKTSKAQRHVRSVAAGKRSGIVQTRIAKNVARMKKNKTTFKQWD